MSTLTYVERNELHLNNIRSEEWLREHGYDFIALLRKASGMEMSFNIVQSPGKGQASSAEDGGYWSAEIYRYDEDTMSEFEGTPLDLREHLLWALDNRHSKLWSEAYSVGTSRDDFLNTRCALEDRFDVIRVERQVKAVEEEKDAA